MKPISIYLPNSDNLAANELIKSFSDSSLVEEIFIPNQAGQEQLPSAIKLLNLEGFGRSRSVRKIAESVKTEYLLLVLTPTITGLQSIGLERFLQIAKESKAGIVYSDYNEFKNGLLTLHQTIDYQIGSIRDDFDFGPILFIKMMALLSALTINPAEYQFAGLYDLRLKISEIDTIMRIPEVLYSVNEFGKRSSEKRLFAYVDPGNRDLQIEMERAATAHLKNIGAFLEPVAREVEIGDGRFEYEVSVIIPVKDRIRTIDDAIRSAAGQITTFPFNIIVVDNHSNDGTTDRLKELSLKYKNMIHLIPETMDLLIGGCWNLAVHHPRCGRFAVQLDSDDVYKDPGSLQIIFDTFQKEKCAMVIGSYILSDISLNEIPPGLIDHREWTAENGPNNALRINGLGAPRAFFTPVLRKISIPNVSYGEDYFLGLTFSRLFKIGRIYNPVYYCRRWENNTDAQLDIKKQNAHDFYKDNLRSMEITIRQHLNIEKEQ